MVSQLLSGRSCLIVHLTGWLLIFLSFHYLIGEFRGPDEVWLRTCLNMAFLLVLFYGNAKLLVNRYLEKGHYGRLVGLTIIFWLGLVFLRTWLEVWLFSQTPDGSPIFSEDWKRIFLVSLVSFFLLILFSTLYQLKSDSLLPIYFVMEGDLFTRSMEPLLLLPIITNKQIIFTYSPAEPLGYQSVRWPASVLHGLVPHCPSEN